MTATIGRWDPSAEHLSSIGRLIICWSSAVLAIENCIRDIEATAPTVAKATPDRKVTQRFDHLVRSMERTSPGATGLDKIKDGRARLLAIKRWRDTIAHGYVLGHGEKLMTFLPTGDARRDFYTISPHEIVEECQFLAEYTRLLYRVSDRINGKGEQF